MALQAVSVDCRMPGVDPQTLGAMTERVTMTGKQCGSIPAPQRAVLMTSVTAEVIIKHCVIV